MIARRRCFALVTGLALLVCGAAARAGTWVDRYGRTLKLDAPGLVEATLTSGTRGADAMASTFKSLCLDTALDRGAAGRAAEAAGFRYVAASMPFKNPVDVGSWVAPDAELTVGRDMFFAKEPQCGLVMALPAGVDAAAVTTALSSVIGMPANAGKATTKGGSVNKRWQPEWLVPGAPAGVERRVFVHQIQPARVQIAVVERKGAN